MPPERIDFHLLNWRAWMFDDRDELPRGYPRRCPLTGRGVSNDFDGMLTAADELCAKATDAVIDALPPVERCAVHAKHLGTLWRFSDPLPAVYERAAIAIGRGLERRGVA